MDRVQVLARMIAAAGLALVLAASMDTILDSVQTFEIEQEAVEVPSSPIELTYELQADEKEVVLITNTLTGEEAKCMAMNLYHEARGEEFKGLQAVFSVTMNRVRSNKYPNTVCKVVWQNRQFSWTQDGLPDTPKDTKTYSQMYEYATMFSMETDTVNEATHYYSHSKVTPYWSSSLIHVALIGNHTFGSMN